MSATTASTIFAIDSPVWPILAVLLGVVVGYFLTALSAWNSRRGTKKRVATLLAFEIEAVRQIAQIATERHGKELDEVKTALKSTNDPKRTLAIYTQFQTDIYQRPTTDLTLFNDKLAATISELYRWLSLSEQDRKMNIKAVEEVAPYLHPLNPVYGEPEQKVIEAKIELMITFGESYLDKLSHVIELAANAISGLHKINPSIDLSKVRVGNSTSAVENKFLYEPAIAIRA
jgi:hypothetical protein